MPSLECNAHPKFMDRNLDLREDLNRNSYQLLRVDIDAALTFARIAAAAEAGSEKRTRNKSNARNAYDSIQHLRKNVPMTEQQERELEVRVAELRGALKILGDSF
jgi:hypothetical protein